MTDPTPDRRRIESVDLLRGVIMILMALDHVRDYFGDPAANPTDLATTTVPLFFTRWFTHFCAPVFFLLTGTGAYLMLRRKSVPQLSAFLLTRGLWLIVLELTVVRCLGFQFNFDYRVTLLNVLWALGWSMIALSALVWLDTRIVIGIGIVMVALHDLLDPIRLGTPLWAWLHAPGFIFRSPEHVVFAAYPIIPWIGVTAAGYGLGQVYGWDADRRKRFLVRLGLAVTAGFVLLRLSNVYGDPTKFAVQGSAGMTVVSFLDLVKYPPSLLFLMMTLGPAMIFLALVDDATPRLLRPALIYGKVPMFYFLVHLPLIHGLAAAVCLVRYGSAHWMFESPDLGHFPYSAPPGWGYSLPVVYGVWIVVVVALYPACNWFAGVKARRTDAWLSYL